MTIADIVIGFWALMIVMAIAVIGFGLSAMGTFDKDNNEDN